MIEAAAANGWEIVRSPCGRCVAAVAGTEIHVELQPGALRRGAVRAFLAPLLDRAGFLTTRVPHGDTASDQFVRRLGFVKTWDNDTYNHYMLTALPFERKEARCLQQSQS